MILSDSQNKSLRQWVGLQNPDQFSMFINKIRAILYAYGIHLDPTLNCVTGLGFWFLMVDPSARLLSGIMSSTLSLLLTDGWGRKAPGFMWEDQLKQPASQGLPLRLRPLLAWTYHPCSQLSWLAAAPPPSLALFFTSFLASGDFTAFLLNLAADFFLIVPFYAAFLCIFKRRSTCLL